MGLHRRSKGDFLGWNSVFDASRWKVLGTAPSSQFVVECPAHWGTCSGTRDLAKRQLGAMQKRSTVKELKSLFFL